MRKYKIFVSGVQKELRLERRAIKDFIKGDILLSEYFDVFLFEDAPAKSKSAKNLYLDEVIKSDIYLGILGRKYGAPTIGALSPTEAEFRQAKAKHKEILIYIKGPSTADKKRDRGMQKLIKEIRDPRVGYSYKRFKDTGELTNLVYESLISFLKEKGEIGKAEFDQRVCKGAKLSDIDKACLLYTSPSPRD